MEQRLRPARTIALALFAALLPWAWLTWRFDYLSDDAYINFAYARHLARGFGLRFNLDEDPPVEAYNALWTVVMALPEWIGWNAPAASKVATVASAFLLLAYVLFFVHVRLGLSPLATALVGLFLATLPPFAMWSTSGMEALPTVLFLFAAYERLLGPREPRGWQAGLCAAIAGAMRPDGVPLAAVIVVAGCVAGLALHRRALVRAALACGLVLGVTFALHTGFRLLYHHAWVPNTVRVKGEMNELTLERGFDYFMTMMLAFPGLVVVLVLGLVLTLKRPWIERTLPLAVVVACYLGYLVAVGADFMPMGRFLLNALPFLAVGWGSVLRVLESGRARAAAIPLTAVCIALSLPAAFDRHVVPESLRKRFDFRWGQENFVSEYQGWATQRDNTTRWVREGRALARYTKRGESLIRGPIGAVGYHAELFLYDLFGLTDRDVIHREPRPERRLTAGHTRLVTPDYFLPQKPTYRFMRLQTWKDDSRLLLYVEPAALAVGLQTRVERHPLSGFPGFEADELLELHRLMPLDTDFDMVLAALEVARGVDLHDAAAAEAELTRREAPVDVLGQRLAQRAQDLIANAPRQPGPSRVDERKELARGWRAELWYHNGQAPARKYKQGAVHLIVPVGGAPLVDGRAPGWTVVPPDGIHAPNVTGGVAAFLTLQPQ